MLLLSRWIGSRQYRTRFTEAEIELTEQPLALAHAQLDSIHLVDPGRKSLAIPEIHSHARVARLGPQHPIDFFHLLFVQSAGTTGPFSLNQTGQSFSIEAMNPILDRTWRIAQEASNLRAGHALRYQ